MYYPPPPRPTHPPPTVHWQFCTPALNEWMQERGDRAPKLNSLHGFCKRRKICTGEFSTGSGHNDAPLKTTKPSRAPRQNPARFCVRNHVFKPKRCPQCAPSRPMRGIFKQLRRPAPKNGTAQKRYSERSLQAPDLLAMPESTKPICFLFRCPGDGLLTPNILHSKHLSTEKTHSPAECP
jgi:hypothetical protein